MAIDFTGHCRLGAADAQRRIDYLRRERPDWYRAPRPKEERLRLPGPPAWLDGVLLVTDAAELGPFGREIAMEFGMERCSFLMSVLDKQRLDAVREAVERVYEVFGTDDLLVTWGNDTRREPLRAYEGLRL